MILALVPGSRFRGAGAVGRLLVIFFWVYGSILVVCAGRLVSLGAGERATVFAGVVALGAGAAGIRVGGRQGRRFEGSTAAFAGLVVVLAFLCAAVLAPLLSGYGPSAFEQASSTRLLPPSLAHPLGTDRLGRDGLSRLLHGARVSMFVASASVLLSAVIALVLGFLAGTSRGWIDDVISRLIDAMLSFPRQLLVLTLVAFFANSLTALVVLIACTSWMRTARLVRVEALRLRETEFVRAAHATGLSPARIIWRHMLPNALGPVLVAATLNAGAVILLESYLSFLGLGVRPPQPSWGAMVFDGRDLLQSAWWVSAFPAAAITVVVVAFNMMGDGLRDAFGARGVDRSW